MIFCCPCNNLLRLTSTVSFYSALQIVDDEKIEYINIYPIITFNYDILDKNKHILKSDNLGLEYFAPKFGTYNMTFEFYSYYLPSNSKTFSNSVLNGFNNYLLSVNAKIEDDNKRQDSDIYITRLVSTNIDEFNKLLTNIDNVIK